MSNEVNNNSNNEISLQELRQKIANVEETAYTDSGTKSIFNAYNSVKAEGENALEYLGKEELQALIKDIEKYDGKAGGKADGKIDLNEALIFVNDFNQKHPDAKIETKDVFKFVKEVFSRYDMHQNTPRLTQGLKFVGEPLNPAPKIVQMHCMIDGKEEVIKIEINLYATNDKSTPQVFVNNVVAGKEFKQKCAEQYGYKGNDAWGQFFARSVKLKSATSYDISFYPQYKSTSPKDVKTDGVNGSNPVVNISTDGIDHFYAANGLDKDPRLIYSQYQDPEVQQTMKDFIATFSSMLDQADQNLDEYWKTYGFTAKTADFLSKIWNNDYVGGENSNSQIKEKIADFKKILESMSQTGNTMEDILQHKDFGGLFKELTGQDFDPKSVKEFVEARNDYLKKEAVIATYRYAHETIDNALAEFSYAYVAYKNPPFDSIESFQSNIDEGNYGLAIAQSAMMSQDPYSGSGNRFRSVNADYENAKDTLYDVFHNLLGITKENWNKMFKELEAKGQNPIEVLKKMAESIKSGVDTQAREVLGITDLSGIDGYEKSLNNNYNLTKKVAIGSSDMLDKVEKYNNSQVIGGAVVGALIQIGMYAMGVGPLGTALSISSGVASGICYGGSYLAIDVVDRLTNGIDNREDLFNCETIAELAGNTAIEFTAGYLFDGILKSKFFGKAEKAAYKMESNVAADAIGDASIKSPLKRFSEKEVVRLVAARGLAGVVGGTKDGTKELFKQTLKLNWKLSDVGSAFLFGAITSAFLLRFKNSNFAKQDHKILGKFIEKAPKKGVKSEIKAEASTQEEQEYKNIINSIKADILEEIKKSNGPENAELKAFMAQNDAKIEDIIMAYYISMYCTNYG